jgi:hypothetical protein
MKQENSQNLMKEKILLVLLPFWTPLIPPMGLACLKGFLQQNGCNVRAVDANTNEELKQIYHSYLEILKEYLPLEKQGNYYNIGNYVWQEHIMAHINYDDETAYIRLIKKMIRETFYKFIDDQQANRLKQSAQQFITALEKYLENLLEAEKPGVLGLSVYSGTLPASVFAYRMVHEKYPHIKTLMGGGIFAESLAPGSPNLDIFLEKTKDIIDKLIIGESEVLLLKYLRGELPKDQRVYTIKDIDGEIFDLDKAPIPDLSDFQLHGYPHLGSYASRSCPFQCKFCSETIQWGRYRKKKAPQIANELLHLLKEHGHQLILMGDSLLNPVVTDLAKELENNEKSIYWDGYLRADKPVTNIENTMLWRRGGFYRARLGLESGSPRVLEMMGKKITPPQIKEAVSNLAYAGIKTTTYWVIGFPGETEEDFRQTLKLVEEMKDDIYEADCNPFVFFLSGQINSHQWAQTRKCIPLYPGKDEEMLILQTWYLDGEPSREETFSRVNRFMTHCRKLKIPNPYFLHDIYEADKRWTKLHHNAVPPLVDFLSSRKNGSFINENKQMKDQLSAKNVLDDDGDFGF